jgi:hypothetical protein
MPRSRSAKARKSALIHHCVMCASGIASLNPALGVVAPLRTHDKGSAIPLTLHMDFAPAPYSGGYLLIPLIAGNGGFR